MLPLAVHRRRQTARPHTKIWLVKTHRFSVSLYASAEYPRIRRCVGMCVARVAHIYFFAFVHAFVLHTLRSADNCNHTKWLCLISFYGRDFFFAYAHSSLILFAYCYSFALYLAYHLVHFVSVCARLFVLSQHAEPNAYVHRTRNQWKIFIKSILNYL